jgi:membrane protein
MTAAARQRPGAIERLGRRGLRSVRLGVRAARKGFVEFYNSDDLTFASSIAYYALLSFFPFILLLLTVLSRLAIGMDDDTLVRVILLALPRHFEFVIRQIHELSVGTPALGIAGTAIMAWAAMGVFGAVTSAVNHAWGVDEPHGFLQHKLIAGLMLLVSALLMIAALSLVGAAEVSETQGFARLRQYLPWLGGLQNFALRNAPTPMFVLIVGLICYFVPNARVRLRDVWWGALIAGGLWRVAFAGFSWYVRDISRFSVHGTIGGVVAFLIWVYVSAAILLYGVEVSAAYARLRKHLPQEAPAAAVREA